MTNSVIALLSWWDERPQWLADCVTSVAPFTDHLVAVDGAYAAFPNGTARSDPEQARTIKATCDAHRIGCTLYAPQTTWQGGEVEKRSHLFHLAEAVATPNDWYFVIDADERVTHGADTVRASLATLVGDVASVRLWNDMAASDREWAEFVLPPDISQPRFCRAIPGLRVNGSHFGWVTPDGRYLWSEESTHLDAIRVEHRTQLRAEDRQAAKYAYYQQLPTLEDQGPPVRSVSFDPTRTADTLRPEPQVMRLVGNECEPVAEANQPARRFTLIGLPSSASPDGRAPVQVQEVEIPVRRNTPIRAVKVGRNAPCPCGSGAKHKRCCGSVGVA